MPDIISDFADIKRRANLLKGADEHYAAPAPNVKAVDQSNGYMTSGFWKAMGQAGLCGQGQNLQIAGGGASGSCAGLNQLYANTHNNLGSAGSCSGTGAGGNYANGLGPSQYNDAARQYLAHGTFNLPDLRGKLNG